MRENGRTGNTESVLFGILRHRSGRRSSVSVRVRLSLQSTAFHRRRNGEEWILTSERDKMVNVRLNGCLKAQVHFPVSSSLQPSE